MSPPEATWRIFSFDLYDMQPLVMLLQVHLPNKQSVFFNDAENLAHVVGCDKRGKTVLMEFFPYNATHPSEPKYCFPEFAEHHVWLAQSKSWNRRKRSKVIGRLAFVAPSEGERYYLRLLLARVVGPCSFEDLLTINNQPCSTFHEAALKREFVEPDNLIGQCLNEAIEVRVHMLYEDFLLQSSIFLNRLLLFSYGIDSTLTFLRTMYKRIPMNLGRF